MASTSRHTGSSYVPYSSSTCHWNVFLSFRGIDTRTNFTGHLYEALDRSGIRTFMDDPELRKGEEISSGLLKAIQESKISIVVFSRNYASSKWCLDELVKILECRRTIGQLVLPVFFHVTPADVRYQLGNFAEGFEKHELRFVADMDKVDKWRATLTEAANFSGYHVDENVDESKIIKDIITKVALEVNPKYMNVAKYPVGIESRIKHINTLLSIGSSGVRRIGIYGMGGVGKTTIAKAIYNDIIHFFEGTCFIENVRESSIKENGVVGLQKQLVWDILKMDEKIPNVSAGMSLIEQRIRSKKILIVLDDVDHIKHSDALVGEWNQFASGSRIIITTRDEGLLNQIGVDERYNIEGLEKDESLLLFSWHAFRKATPLENYKEISEDIVHYAAGLPLALEVLGSNLYKRTLEEWRGSLHKLKQIPHDEIQEKLIISFHALPGYNLKDIFLDIACFFIGMDRFEAIEILDSCGFDSENEINILVERCLLSINDKNKLRMHVLLRDMGREIVKNESPKEPGKHSRLWSYKDICSVLEKGKGAEAIEGIIPHIGSMSEAQLYFRKIGKSQVRLDTKTFERMHRLRLLNIDGVHVTGSFKHLFEELRWLSWHDCPLQCLPADFKPEELRILDLQGSQVITLWHDILILQHLKILKLNNCQLLTTTPNFTGVASLQELILSGCKNLVEVHESVGCLSRLVYLHLRDCTKLEILPRKICNLRELTYLNIDGCSKLEALPEEFGNLQCLKVFSGHGCGIKKIPDSIGLLSMLVNLDLGYCKNLMYLPSSLCNLRALETLNLQDCSNVEGLPEELGNIESLRELWAGGTSIKKLPDSIGFIKNLEILDLTSCTNLNLLFVVSVPPSICGLCSLRKLNLTCCNLFDEDIPENIGSLSSLEELNLSGNYFCSLPSSLIRLSNLKVLLLSSCECLVSLSELPPNLERLHLSWCISMERLPNISNLKYLEVFSLSYCRSLGEIQGSENLNAIEVLHMDGCCNLVNTFDENFFKLYPGFGRKIDIFLPTREISDWFGRGLSRWRTMTIPPFKPNTFLGMILRYVCGGLCSRIVHVENKTNGTTRVHSQNPWKSKVHSWVRFMPQTQLPVNKGDQIEVSFEAWKPDGYDYMYCDEDFS